MSEGKIENECEVENRELKDIFKERERKRDKRQKREREREERKKNYYMTEQDALVV